MGQPGDISATVEAAADRVRTCVFQLMRVGATDEKTHVQFWADRLRNALYEILRFYPKAAFATIDGFSVVVEKDRNNELWLLAEHAYLDGLDGLHQSMKFDTFVAWYVQNIQIETVGLSGGV